MFPLDFAMGLFGKTKTASSYTWYQWPGTKAAYQAKAAASLAASLVNLANPGTNDLSVPVTDPVSASPTWNATDGRIYDGISQTLSTGAISIIPNTATLFIRYSDLTLSGTSINLLYLPQVEGGVNVLNDSEGDGVGIFHVLFGNMIAKVDMDSAPINGVIAANNYGLYLDGNLIATNETAASTDPTSINPYIAYYAPTSSYTALHEQALMLHDNGTSVLSATAIKDISDQLAAI